MNKRFRILIAVNGTEVAQLSGDMEAAKPGSSTKYGNTWIFSLYDFYKKEETRKDHYLKKGISIGEIIREGLSLFEDLIPSGE